MWKTEVRRWSVYEPKRYSGMATPRARSQESRGKGVKENHPFKSINDVRRQCDVEVK